MLGFKMAEPIWFLGGGGGGGGGYCLVCLFSLVGQSFVVMVFRRSLVL
jgi:hypothetical protein